jgi:hypothetical protein
MFRVTSEECLEIYISGPENPPVTSPSSSSSFPAGSPRVSSLCDCTMHNVATLLRDFYPISKIYCLHSRYFFYFQFLGLNTTTSGSFDVNGGRNGALDTLSLLPKCRSDRIWGKNLARIILDEGPSR